MASERFTFTRVSIAAVIPPEKGRKYCLDDQARGLIIDVQASGTKTFQVYRKFSGSPVRIALGQFDPNMTESRDLPFGTDTLGLIGNSARINVKIARKLAEAVNASLDKGVNPSVEARRRRILDSQDLTLRQAFDRYYVDHLIPQGKKTAEDLRNDFARYLGKVPPGQKKPRGKEKEKSPGSVDWELRKLSAISQSDIRAMMIGIKDNIGHRTANKVFILLRSLYNKIIRWNLYTGASPCDGIQKFREITRDRYITGDEFPRFWAALEKIDHLDFKEFVFLSLFTGARRENVLSMRWADLNFHAGFWTIPSELSKNGSPLTIPITTVARTILERRRKSISETDDKNASAETKTYVFSSKGKKGYMSSPNKRWKAFLLAAGIDNLRLHDLRRTLGSWAANGNTSTAIIGRMLGHKSSEATAIYMRLQIDPVRTAMEAATVLMQESSKDKQAN